MSRKRKVRRTRRTRTDPTGQNIVGTSLDNGGADPPKSAEERFREEYAYVMIDLRRVFVIAAAMFTLLIALNLLI